MKSQMLEKKAAQLMSKIMVCVGINLLAFLALGFYTLNELKKLDSSGIREIEPSIHERQLGLIKMQAVVGIAVAFIPLITSLKFLNKRSKVLQELKIEQAKFIENFNID
jgi:hypothetical protein